MDWRFGHISINQEVPEATDFRKLEVVNFDSPGVLGVPGLQNEKSFQTLASSNSQHFCMPRYNQLVILKVFCCVSIHMCTQRSHPLQRLSVIVSK